MRILAVQWADIGDLILTTPALSALRQAHPQAHIALLTSPHAAPLVEGTGLVDAVYPLPRYAPLRQMLRLFWQLRAERFDHVMFFHHLSTRSGALKYALLAYLSGARRRIGLDNGRGRFLTDRVTDVGFERHHAEYWLALVSLLGADPAPRPCVVARAPFPLPDDRPYIVVHAGGGPYNLARRWEPQALAQAADRIAAEHGARIVLVGGAGDDSAAVRANLTTPDVLDITGQTRLPQLASVLAGARRYLGTDSGVSHLAAAVGAPAVVIFGPTSAAAWRPWDVQTPAAVVRSGVECSPCSFYGHSLGSKTGCAARTCMRLVTVDAVVDAARQPAAYPPPAPAPPSTSTPAVTIVGIPVHAITFEGLLAQIGEWVRAGDRAHHICTVNPEFVMVAQQDPIFRAILLRSDLNVADGVGLLWAAKRLGRALPERVTGSDGVPLIAERAAREGWRVFFLGAAEGVAERAAAVLTARHPALRVAGVYAGSPRPDEEDAIVERVNASGADVLFVAYGAPVQDQWIARNLPRLRVAMAMGVGGSFDFIAGIVPRAPIWMRRAGLEWLFRLVRQPWRARRMLRLPRFVWAVLRQTASSAP
jgi:N-acetylglucosaminyldiphosphoundecaprenol N-acetyl-beta-D-mannosaminyltransferase